MTAARTPKHNERVKHRPALALRNFRQKTNRAIRAQGFHRAGHHVDCHHLSVAPRRDPDAFQGHRQKLGLLPQTSLTRAAIAPLFGSHATSKVGALDEFLGQTRIALRTPIAPLLAHPVLKRIGRMHASNVGIAQLSLVGDRRKRRSHLT